MKSLDEAAAEARAAIVKFHKDQQGLEPETVLSWIVHDMVVFRICGVFTPTERELAKTTEGRKIVQSARRELRALTRRQVEAEVSQAIGIPVRRSYCDLDVRIAEQVEVYVLERPWS